MLKTVNIRSSVAVYVQIENHIRFAIAAGKLKPDDQLPSVRELSERLDVNPNTVAKAYRDLEVMGLLYTRRGTGVFIEKHARGICQGECKLLIIKKLHETIVEAREAGMTKTAIGLVVGKSFITKCDLYGETPASVLALVRK